MAPSRTCIFKSILAISILFVVLGIGAKWIAAPFFMQDVVWRTMRLIPGTLGYDVWVRGERFFNHIQYMLFCVH